jgi:hypothetical protein
MDKEQEEFHPVVQLLLARIESNPEEFNPPGRWDHYLNINSGFFNNSEREAINAARRVVVLGELHKQIMSVLLNGNENARQNINGASQHQLLQSARPDGGGSRRPSGGGGGGLFKYGGQK